MPKKEAINIEEVQTIANYEGLTIEEATILFKERKNLPTSVFAGPSRTYPVQDVENVRIAFSKLSKFAHRINSTVKTQILECLKRKAKRYGIENEETIQMALKILESPEEEVKSKVEWFLEKEGLI